VIAELTREELPSLFALFDALMKRPDSMGIVGSRTATK